MKILVTGGAGYIGSHTVKYLEEKNVDVVIVDNLTTGNLDTVENKKFYKLDIRDTEELDKVFKKEKFDGVVHFAANSLVGESVEKPSIYYNNNVYGMLCLLDTMRNNDVKNIVFSSTAATYGEPKRIPILESDDTIPTNPYGETKLAMEKMMYWFENAYGVKYVSLRYFNAAGAHKDGSLGERRPVETHLIPLILQVPVGKREYISIFGTDYDTKDHTCIRDYIHVVDLAQAHYLAIKHIIDGKPSDIFNLGNGLGYSVKEVIDVARKVTNHPIPAKEEPRRAGDPAVLVASSEKAKKVLGWKPEYESLETIVGDAWAYYKENYKTKFK